MSIHEKAKPEYLKWINRQKILQRIWEENGLSRAKLSQQLKISKPTVSNIVDELIKEGWVWEIQSQKSDPAGGRRPYELYFNEEARHVVGVDIGGTNVEIALMNLKGEIKQHSQLDTQVHLEKDLIRSITDQILDMLNKQAIPDEQVLGIGVGVPGITNTDEGVVVDAPSLRWTNFPLKDKLGEILPYPVYIDNDVNVAALGEQWKGRAHDKKNVILISLGTGVGCGIILDGQVYRGSNYAAGEIGYMVTDKTQAEKEYDPIFSGYGFLDSHVGGPSIVKRMREKLKEKNLLEKEKSLSAKDIFHRAFEHNDPLALEVVEDVISHIGIAIVNVVAMFNPECVILGGGISKSGHWFLPKIKTIMQKHLPFDTEVYITELPHVSLLGAAALCLKAIGLELLSVKN